MTSINNLFVLGSVSRCIIFTVFLKFCLIQTFKCSVATSAIDNVTTTASNSSSLNDITINAALRNDSSNQTKTTQAIGISFPSNETVGKDYKKAAPKTSIDVNEVEALKYSNQAVPNEIFSDKNKNITSSSSATEESSIPLDTSATFHLLSRPVVIIYQGHYDKKKKGYYHDKDEFNNFYHVKKNGERTKKRYKLQMTKVKKYHPKGHGKHDKSSHYDSYEWTLVKHHHDDGYHHGKKNKHYVKEYHYSYSDKHKPHYKKKYHHSKDDHHDEDHHDDDHHHYSHGHKKHKHDGDHHHHDKYHHDGKHVKKTYVRILKPKKKKVMYPKVIVIKSHKPKHKDSKKKHYHKHDKSDTDCSSDDDMDSKH